MFINDSILYRSDLLSDRDILHGFSTREGGVSRLAHTSSMNVAEGHGDTADIVLENIGILARTVSDGTLTENDVVSAPQIHSAILRYVTGANAGEGVTRPAFVSGDGFFTDQKGVLLMVRVADCVPILFKARRKDGSPLVAAVHAGWRGTVSGIAPRAVQELLLLGADLQTVRAAIGPCIHDCCFEVKEDFYSSVTDARGETFAHRHIKARDGRLTADLIGMNRDLLGEVGLTADRIDISPHCTACAPNLFHSHRATKGVRGAMGAMIGIRKICT